MDTVSPAKRSEIMARIKSKDTKPEILIQKMIYGMGFRFRLHVTSLPGRPDITYHRMKKVIFVNGCFWHHHNKCKYARMPKSNLEFWIPKLTANQARDARNIAALEAEDWETLTIREYELSDAIAIKKKLTAFLTSNKVSYQSNDSFKI